MSREFVFPDANAPRDPMIESLVRMSRQAAGTGLTRRSLLAGAGAAGLLSLLAACGTGGTTPSGGGETGAALTPATDLSDTEKLVRWSNWTLYLDYDDSSGTYPTLEKFIETSGIDVTYTEDIDSNDSYFGKYQNQLSNGQDIGADVMTLTDWMVARLMRLGYVQPLTLDNMPNVKANMLPEYMNASFDEGRKYSVTWQGGFTGLAWNKEQVPNGLHTLDDLWDPEYKGRVVVLDEMLDTMALLLMGNGVDIASDWGDDEFDAALDVLKEHIASGQIRQVKGNSYKEDLISGDAVAVLAWSGDITQLNFENGDRWDFALPESGGDLWADNFTVPMGGTHTKNVETLIDYYYQPEVAAEVAAYVNYICPVEGAREEMEKIDPELANNELIFPTEEYLANSQTMRALTPEEDSKYNQLFQQAIGN
jgi:spermidine/putrescine transport system substrate-binding protein